MDFSTPANLSPDQRDAVAAKLRHLCETGNLTTVFQPIVSLQTAEIVAFEALARPGRDSGFGNPGELFDAAERVGMVWEVEALARRKALEVAADFPEGTVLFFNSSPQVMGDARFIDSLQKELTDTALTPARLVLEITERSDESLGQALIEQAVRLKSLGFTLAIDDVGAGTSGLNRMMVLRPQWLKLDRELIDGIDRDRYKINLIKLFVHFARLSGAKVIAEGIETQEELSTLISLGVAHGQGYYLGRPKPQYQLLEAETRDFLRSRWIDGLLGAGGVERAETLGNLVLPTTVVQASTHVSEVAQEMLTDAECAGVVVMDGRRFAGWAPREAVLKLASGGAASSGIPVATAVTPGIATISPSATVGDGLERVAVREENELTAPLVLADAEKIVGIVPLRSLVSAAAAQARAGWGRRGALQTDVPGRVMGELHVRELIEVARLQAKSPAGNIDAAIIDLRDFAAYNETAGYDAGDRLIQELTELLIMHVVRPPPFGYLAHLGCDRFLATGRSGELEKGLCKFMAVYSARADVAACPPLRVLMMPRVFSRLKSPKELFQLEREMRARGDSSGQPGTMLVVDEDDDRVRRRMAG